MRRFAATIRPALWVLLALSVSLSLFCLSARADNSAERRTAAKGQFGRAEALRQELEARPEKDRSLKNYSAVVGAYRRVYLITPRAAEVPAALHQTGLLYRAMGDLFDSKYYKMAIDSDQFLLREYPASRYREDALLEIAQIELEDLHDAALAQKSYDQFLKLYPHSPHAAELRAALAKANQPAAVDQSAPTGAAERRSTAATVAAPSKAQDSQSSQASRTGGDSPADGSTPVVTRIRTWNADSYTRVVIDIGGKARYQAARITSPDRIYFDIENAKLNRELLHQPVQVETGGFLKSVRVAQNQNDLVRVVLDVNHAKDYSVFLLPDPYRLVVDIYGTTAAAEAAARATMPPPGPTTGLPATPDTQPAESQATSSAKAPAPLQTSAGPSASKPEAAQRDKASAASASPGAEAPLKVRAAEAPTKSSAVASANPTPPTPSPAIVQQPRRGAAAPATLSAENRTSNDAPMPTRAPAPPKDEVRNTKTAHEQAEEMGPAAVPTRTRNGQQSLTRALGLKIGRIVIDAGHGGHDTGTIGPTGLMEKDLCLDIALRVGKLIQQRLAGADVVYTREDDSFVSLEQRTATANDARADLFLSVHANSSRDKRARGIETYYLNFTGSSDAMEVAARENALSENSVHDLQDLVSKIARNEKIEESRDFATDIQESLAKRIQDGNRSSRNRGVRKAPFVVLIGANMPSVLAEISFISNPSDELWLKRPENRQRVAEGLYRGIESYLHSTNSLTYNQSHPNPAHSGILARSGNPQ